MKNYDRVFLDELCYASSTGAGEMEGDDSSVDREIQCNLVTVNGFTMNIHYNERLPLGQFSIKGFHLDIVNSLVLVTVIVNDF